MDYYPKTFIIMGSLFGAMGAFFIVVGVLANSALLPQTYTVFSMAVLSFSISFLYPQFKQKDERMKLIRQKAIGYSFIAMMVYISLLLLGIELNVISLNVVDALTILISLSISTLFLTMVALAKKY
ncbi:permease [Pontibacillus salipaludis]|uniref:permease n=1 Tax=Pontibacillus salipaludis TaxID=1697394 RepID=UPI0031E9A702